MAEPFIMTIFTKQGLIKPASDEDLAFLKERYQPETVLKGKFSQQRSLKHHNLYWAVLRRIVALNGGVIWPNAEALDYAVKVHMRMFGGGIQLLGGGVRFEVQSISYASMDQGAFKLFFEQAMDAIAEVTCIDVAQVIDEVKRNIGWTRDDEKKLRAA